MGDARASGLGCSRALSLTAEYSALFLYIMLIIRDEQEREAEFRDQSESTNARVVRWTLLQLLILGLTCVWQLSHLRAFFIKQKLT